MGYLKNAWYVAAWSGEVDDKPLGRTIMDVPVVLFRDQDGQLAALEDRCAHRFAALSMGTVVEGTIRCAYHGVQYDRSGACAHNPHGAFPRSAAIRTFPIEERHMIAWIWMGDAALADPALIPDYSFYSDAPPAARARAYLHVKANYMLMCDNIMDLTHTDYLHSTTLGNGAITGTKTQLLRNDDIIVVRWDTPQAPIAPLFTSLVPDPTVRLDQWAEVEWSAGCSMRLQAGFLLPNGEPLVTTALHIMTPETATTCHYFFGGAGDVDEEANRQMSEESKALFANEDLPAVEAQQARMGEETDLLAMGPRLFASDAAVVAVRRRVAQLIARETAAGGEMAA